MKLTRGRNEILLFMILLTQNYSKKKHDIVIGSSQREGDDSKTVLALNLTN